MKTDKIYPYPSARLDAIRRSSDQIELIQIKTNTEKKVDKVLPGEILTLISFNVNALTQVNSEQT